MVAPAAEAACVLAHPTVGGHGTPCSRGHVCAAPLQQRPRMCGPHRECGPQQWPSALRVGQGRSLRLWTMGVHSSGQGPGYRGVQGLAKGVLGVHLSCAGLALVVCMLRTCRCVHIAVLSAELVVQCTGLACSMHA